MSFWSSFGSGLRRVGQGLVQNYQPVFKPSFRTPGYNPAAPLPFSQDQTIDPPDPLTAFGDPNTNRDSAQAQEWDSGMDAEFDYGSYQPAAPAGEGLGTISFAEKYDGGRRGQDSMPMRPAHKALAPYQGEAGAAATADPDDVANYPTNTSPWNPSRVELSFPGAPSEQSKVGSATRRYLELLDRAPQERMKPKSTLRTILGGVAGAGLTLAGRFGLPPSIAHDLTDRVTYGNDTLNRRKDYEEQLGAAQLGAKIEMENEKTDQARELKLAQMQAQQARFTLGQLGIQHRADESNLARYMNQGAYALPDDYQAGSGFMNAQYGTNFPGADLRGDQVLNKGGIKKQIGGVTLGIPTREQRVGTEATLVATNRGTVKMAQDQKQATIDDPAPSVRAALDTVPANDPLKSYLEDQYNATQKLPMGKGRNAEMKRIAKVSDQWNMAKAKFPMSMQLALAAVLRREQKADELMKDPNLVAFLKTNPEMLSGLGAEVQKGFLGKLEPGDTIIKGDKGKQEAAAMDMAESSWKRLKNLVVKTHGGKSNWEKTGPSARLSGLGRDFMASIGNDPDLQVLNSILTASSIPQMKAAAGGTAFGSFSDAEWRIVDGFARSLRAGATKAEYESYTNQIDQVLAEKRKAWEKLRTVPGGKTDTPGNAAALKVETRTSAQAKALAAAKNMTVGQLTEALAAKGVKLVIKD